MKTLSIVVPVYNTEQFLDRCLNSVLVPEVTDQLELIIVNDGSKDNSANIIRDYAARYPDTIVFIDKKNGGHGSTINAGLAVASGKYFRVLDSDDWVDTPEFIKYVDELSHADEDLVVSPYCMEYAYNGEQLAYEYKWLPHNTTIPVKELSYDGTDNYFTIHSSTFKRSVLLESGLKLFEHCFYVDMQYIIAPIPWVKTIRVLDTMVYRYYIGRPEQSMSQQSMRKNYAQHQKVMYWLIDYYAQVRDDVLPNVRNYLAQITQFMYYTNMNLLCKILNNRFIGFQEMRKLDAHVKKVAPDLYKRFASSSYLKYSRKIGFLNVILLRKF